MSALEQHAADLMVSDRGQKGGVLLDDTSAITGTFRKILVLTDTVFTTLTSEYTHNDTSTLAVAADWGTLYAGTELDGVFTAVTLTSGSVLLVE